MGEFKKEADELRHKLPADESYYRPDFVIGCAGYVQCIMIQKRGQFFINISCQSSVLPDEGIKPGMKTEFQFFPVVQGKI